MRGFTFPYLLLAPDYIESSSGVQVIHQLCHMINEQGGKAWMVNCRVNPEWNTPVINSEDWKVIQNSGQPWIAIYPEIVSGNPLSAPVCVRYMLNREGVIMNNRIHEGPDDLFFWYRNEFAEKAVDPQILGIESFDLQLFCDDNPQKDLNILYLNRVPESVVDFIQLPADTKILSMANPLTLKELAVVLKRTRVFYSYESSGTCAMAILCGSPVVALTAPGYEKYAITQETVRDNGGAGFCWENTQEAIDTERQNLWKMRDYFLVRRARSQQQFENFVTLTQEKAEQRAAQDKRHALNDWLYKRQLPAPAEEVQSTSSLPLLRMLIAVQPGSEADRTSTLNALLPQLDQVTGCAVLLATPQETCHVSDDRVFQIRSDVWLNEMNCHLEQNVYDWIYVVPAGCQFTAESLRLLAEALHSRTGCAFVYADEGLSDKEGKIHPHFKPAFCPDLFLSQPSLYLKRGIFARNALMAIGGFNADLSACYELDAITRLLATRDSNVFGHVSEVFTVTPLNSCVAQDLQQEHAVLQSYLQQQGFSQGVVEHQPGKPWRLRYSTEPVISLSIILVAGTNIHQLQCCITTLFEQTHQPVCQLIVIVTPATSEAITAWLTTNLSTASVNINILKSHGSQTQEAAINEAVGQAEGEFLLLLDPRVLFVSRGWLEALACHALRHDVVCVAPHIINLDSQILCAGEILGVRGLAFPVGYAERWGNAGYLSRYQSDCSYSTLATDCLLIRKDRWLEVGGFDTAYTQPLLARLDLNLRLVQLGGRAICTPYSVVAKQEAVTDFPPQYALSPSQELDRFYHAWLPVLADDPAYNKNLSLNRTLFTADSTLVTGWNPLKLGETRTVIFIAQDQNDTGVQRFTTALDRLMNAGGVKSVLLEQIPSAPELLRHHPDELVISGELTDLACQTIRQLKNAITCRVHYLIQDDPNARKYKKLIEDNVIDNWLTYSDALANWLKKRHKPVVILPNVLVQPCQDRVKQKKDKCRVVCFTYDLRKKDCELLTPAITTSAEKLDWIVIGHCPPEWLPYIRETYRFQTEARLVAQLLHCDADIAVLPRCNNDENRYKDNNVLTQLAVMGIPAMYSDHPTFGESVPGWRVKHNPNAWKEAIATLCADTSLSDTLSQQLKEKAYNEVNQDALMTLFGRIQALSEATQA
ncbi:glycosyltransferase family 2 protein [Pantoea sp. SGAir0183]